MIPVEFDYAAPASLEDTIRLLGEGGEDAMLLAGGHSLIPLMKLRLATPSLLVDLRNVPGLEGVRRDDGTWRVGAMTARSELEHHPGLGLLGRAAGSIADPQVRHRGTIGGSLAHADPASDLPAVLLAAGGSVSAQGPGGGRMIDAAELFCDHLTTALAGDEVLTEVHMPALEGWGYGYAKFSRRAGDWAMVAACALVHARDGVCEDVRVALTNMAPVPLRALAAEEALRGQPLTAESIADAAQHAAQGTDPPGELDAGPDYKRHLARVVCGRALEEAAGL